MCWSFHVCTNKRRNILSFLLFVMVSCHFLVLLTSVSVAVIVVLVTFACKTRFKLFFIVTHTQRFIQVHSYYVHSFGCICLCKFVLTVFRFPLSVLSAPFLKYDRSHKQSGFTHTATCKSHLYTNTDKVMRIIYE